MSPDEFRAAGHAAVDWIADYLEGIEEHPVLCPLEPGAVRRRLPASPPEEGEPFDALLADLDRVIVPGLTHWQSPSFFGYFPSNTSPPAILGDLLCAGLGVQGMLWATSPACTELESLVMDWLVQALSLPDAFLTTSKGGGVIQDTASSAVLTALHVARERAGGARKLPRLMIYTSTQAHSSVAKGAKVAGFHPQQIRAIEVDDSLAMRPDALRVAMAVDAASGKLPCFVCATVGTTSTTALDPVPEIARATQEHGAWLHVDGAYAGSAAICPELRFVNAGLEHADSYCFNPHKWLLTNFDCTCFWVRDRAPLLEAMSILPEYLRNAATESGAVIDYRDWHVPLGRRFRALKLWAVMRCYGLSGMQAHVRRHVSLAQTFAGWLDGHERFERIGEVPLGLVCFRHVGGNESTEALRDHLNASGELYLTHTKVGDDLLLRMAIGGRLTEESHVRAAWDQMVAWSEANP
ncbi:MAG: aspartate aminotransferase family protein [Myxococcales bacterium]|nr:aspartate aminotransferase family protein [Myxococcales bacterium]